MGERAERHKARAKQQAGPWLYRVMMPGERLVAGIRAEAGPPPPARTAVIVPLALAALAFASYRLVQDVQGHGLGSGFPFQGLAPLLVLTNFLNRPVFLAVTGQQVICYRLSRYGDEPVRLLFAVPLAEVRLTRYRQGRWFASLRCAAPEGGKVRKRRLAVPRVWQPDLDAVLAALTRAAPATLG